MLYLKPGRFGVALNPHAEIMKCQNSRFWQQLAFRKYAPLVEVPQHMHNDLKRSGQHLTSDQCHMMTQVGHVACHSMCRGEINTMRRVPRL